MTKQSSDGGKPSTQELLDTVICAPQRWHAAEIAAAKMLTDVVDIGYYASNPVVLAAIARCHRVPQEKRKAALLLLMDNFAEPTEVPGLPLNRFVRRFWDRNYSMPGPR